jgi:uncharacterized repeat protein (TIGR01451 family)
MTSQSCGKLQLCRWLATPAWLVYVLAARRPLATAAGLALAAAWFGSAAQPPRAPPRGLVVSSQVEPVGADAAAPHGELVVSVKFTNESAHVVDGVHVTSAVPAGASYVPDSASGPGAEVLFSIDGGRTFGRPDELSLTEADGGVRAAAAAEYTHVRWILRAPLDAGASGVARFRAVRR